MNRIHPQQYSVTILKMIFSPAEKFHMPSMSSEIPRVLSVDHRNFSLKKSVTHDLWSLLAETLYKKIRHAPVIQAATEASRLKQAYYYHMSRARKRREMNGLSTSSVKLANIFSDLKSKSQYCSRGDPEDLDLAASELRFSYTLIGVDAKGHFFHKDVTVSPKPSEHEKIRKVESEFYGKNGRLKPAKYQQPYYAFFVRYRKDRMADWYLLSDLGKYYSLEEKVYGNSLQGTNKNWLGKIYLRPPLMSKLYLNGSPKDIAQVNRKFQKKLWIKSVTHGALCTFNYAQTFSFFACTTH